MIRCRPTLVMIGCFAWPLSIQAAEKPIADLIRQLGSNSFNEREQASKELIAVGEPALEALRTVLKSTDVEVARRASDCIATIERSQKINAILRVLQYDADPTKRDKAAIQLHDFGPEDHPAIVPTLIKALDDRDLEVRVHAAALLGIFGSPAKDAVPRMLEILKDSNEPERMRWCMTSSLARIGHCEEQAVPVLLQLLQSKSKTLRNGAAYALGYLGQKDDRVVPALLQLFQEETEAGVQARAAGSLGKLARDPKVCVPAMVQRLQAINKAPPRKGEYDARFIVIEALGAFGEQSAAAVPCLIEILDDRTDGDTQIILKWPTIKTLGRIGPAAREAIPALQRLAKEDPIFDRDALRALSKINKQ